MTNCRFIHAADLHLDSPFRGLEQIDEEIAENLRDASIDALKNIATAAVERKVDFVLFAGDIYDGAHRGLRAQLAFRSTLAELDAHDIRSFVIYGNHDPLDGWSAIEKFPATTHVFSSVYEAIPFERDGRVIATVHGISYPTNHVKDNLAKSFEPTGDGFEIGLLHCEVDKPDSPYAPCSLDDLIGSGLDYWALGHIHDRRVLCEEPRVVYPGNHQGRSFSEEGPKGVVFVEVNHGKISRFENIQTATWEFRTIDVDVSEAGDIGDIPELVTAAILGAQPTKPTVLRVVLTGRTDVSGILAREGTSAITQELRDAWESQRPRLFLSSVLDKTTASIDIQVVLQRDDFTSEVVRAAEDVTIAPDPLMAVPKNSRTKLRKLIKDMDADIFADARDLALQHLIGE